MAQDEDVVLRNIEEIIIRNSSTHGPAADEPCSIFRVPAHLRSYKTNQRYFEPRLVSIGPYHRNKRHLRAMEKHKRRYFCDFIKENPTDKREEYVKKIRSLLPSIKKCYFESIDDLKDDVFIEMLLLDGCFILQFLIRLYNLKKKRDPVRVESSLSTQEQSAQDASGTSSETQVIIIDPVFRVGWNFPLISTDLLMLENQIPFFVLQELYTIYIGSTADAESSRNQNLDELVLNFIKRVARTSKLNPLGPEVAEIHHLLHFYHLVYIPTMDSNKNSSPAPTVSSRHKRNNRYPRMIRCAMELQEFGITFKKKKEPNNFLDISFKRGVLKIPYTSIEETTKSKYMNLVAFEQCSGIENKNMTSFILFMDFLLNTRNDVIVLQRNGIIENKLANEDDVTEFFSQFNGCCYIRFDEHYLAPLFWEIKEYCEALWPRHRAKLYRDYFSNPWAIFSLCAALLVLSITVFRTVCFILSVFFHYHLN